MNRTLNASTNGADGKASRGKPSRGKAWRGVAGLFALVCVSACATGKVAVSDDAARVADVNWAFSEVAELETRIGSLEAENRTLRGRIQELQGRLQVAANERASAVEEAAEAEAEAARIASLVPAPGVPDPVITAPDPVNDLPDGPAAMSAAPRLVQPSFASADAVFENEARAEGLQLQSVLWGVHLDSYSRENFAREGWRRLQRAYPDELGLLEPRTESVMIEGRGQIYRLIGGGFATEATAKALCQSLSGKNQYCRVVAFSGERLSLAETN